MILGLSIAAFTLLHVIISLVGIGSGVVVLLAMLGNDRVEGWTALFLLTTVLTSVTGFMFPFVAFGPPHAFGIVSLAVLFPAILGRYLYGLTGRWRLAYVVGALVALYLNCVVAVVQFFSKFPVLQDLAPNQTEPPFLVTQVTMLTVFLVLGIVAAIRFRPGEASSLQAARYPGAVRGG